MELVRYEEKAEVSKVLNTQHQLCAQYKRPAGQLSAQMGCLSIMTM